MRPAVEITTPFQTADEVMKSLGFSRARAARIRAIADALLSRSKEGTAHLIKQQAVSKKRK